MYVESNDPRKYHRSNFKHNMGASRRTDWADSTVIICSSCGNGYRWLFISVTKPDEILQVPVRRERCSETWRRVVWYIDTDVSGWPVASRSYPQAASAEVLVSAGLVQKTTVAQLVRISAPFMRFITALTTASYIEGQQNSLNKLTRYSFTSVSILSSKPASGSRSRDRIPVKVRFSTARPHRPWGRPSLM